MKQDLSEKASALLDGELPPDEARFMLRRVEGDADLREAIGRYELIRACLRKEPVVIAPAGFRAAVMDAIDAPAAQRPWLRSAGGVAIAASVMVAALMAVTPKTQDAAVPAAPVAANSEPTISGVTPIRTDDLKVGGVEAQPAAAGIPLGPTRAQAVIYDPQLESYLMRHSNALSNSRGGFVPYVYVVSSPRYVPAPAQGTQDGVRR